MCKSDNVVVTLIGAESIEIPGVSLRIIPWSLETEAELLSSFDVGIMPLPDEPWAQGKCGFKLIQYMASGLPVIASPVGVNKEIIDDGNNGFLSESNEQWVEAFEKLYKNADMRAKMGADGRKLRINCFFMGINIWAFITIICFAKHISRFTCWKWTIERRRLGCVSSNCSGIGA